MAAFPASAPSSCTPSTLPMSPDRAGAGELAGELYIAASLLVEGPNVSLEQVRHEIRTLLTSTSSATSTATSMAPPNSGTQRQSESSAAAAAPSAAPRSISPVEWKKFVTQLLLTTQKLPSAIACLPDTLKREMGMAIQQGKQLCAGKSAAAEALKHVDKAAQIYRSLSGPSYL